MLVLAAGEDYQKYVDLLGEAGVVEIDRFDNGELFVRLQSKVVGQPCVVIGTTAPPDENLLRLTAVSQALLRNGAFSVTAVLPYLGYARQDKSETGGITWVGGLLGAAGIGEVVTIDIHSPESGDLLGIPWKSLSPAKLFAEEITRLGWAEATIVAPDAGAELRATVLVNVLGSSQPIAQLIKQRAGGVSHLELIGEVGERAVIVDDILDSGATLISACQLLRQHGVKQMLVAVTHALFTGNDWEQLFELGVERIITTDTCSRPAELANQKITVLPAATLFANL